MFVQSGSQVPLIFSTDFNSVRVLFIGRCIRGVVGTGQTHLYITDY